MENTASNPSVKYKPSDGDRKYSAYLTSFSNGCLREECRDQVEFKSYCSRKTADGLERRRTRKILIGSTDRMDYSGANYGTSMSEQGEICKFALGVLNQKTNKIKVYDLNVIHLKPVLEGCDDSFSAKEKDYSEKIDDLTAVFGSKKKQHLMKSRIKYKVLDTDAEKSAVSAVNEAMTKELDVSLLEVEEGILPPRNSDAAIEGEVYNVNDIITLHEYDVIEPSAKILQSWSLEDIQHFESSGYSRYVLLHLRNNFHKVPLHKAKLLTYYGYLVEFYKMGVKVFRKKSFTIGIPEVVYERFLEEFLVTSVNENGSENKVIPLRMKNKIMAQAMVLALFIEDFELKLNLFLLDFKVFSSRATKLAYALGCHLVSTKIDGLNQQVAHLRLPLLATKPRRGRPVKKS